VVDKIVEATVKKAFNNTFQTPINEMVFGKAVVVVFILFMIYLVFSFAISIISALIKYYGFTARREQNTLVISYGLLEKKKFTMPVGKIKAVYNRYGFIGQIFGLSAFHIESIGYGDERGEIAILYPLLSEKKKHSLMAVLIPEFEFTGIIVSAPKRALSSYLLVNTLLPLIIGIVLTIAVDYGYAFFGLLPLFLLHGFLSYRNNGILLDRKNIVLRKGAFTKQIVVLPTESVQSTTQAQNFLQKRKNLFNLSFTYQSNTRGKQVGIKYMDTSIQHLYDNIQ
ncbi:MAG: PH domain-containing protein, partial [Vallitaleaceae bacterium]|nr:PH domain-containing protein [Vallitaleaceae bacterium]